MKRIFAVSPALVALVLCVCSGMAGAVDVPLAAPAEFADTSETAGWLWSFLTQDIVMTAMGWLLDVGVIALLGWFGLTSANKWFKAITFILRGVKETYKAYVRPAKLAASDGKLTEDEREEAMRQAIARAKTYAVAEGIPFVQSMSVELMSAIAELIISLMKGGKSEVLVIPAPLSDSRQPPLPELQPVVRASTGEVFGSMTNARG